MHTLNSNQKLTETWTVEIERPRYGAHLARGDVVIAGTSVACSGKGTDIDAAKLDLILRIAVNQALNDAENVKDHDSGIDKLMLSDEALSAALTILRRAQRIHRDLAKREET